MTRLFCAWPACGAHVAVSDRSNIPRVWSTLRFSDGHDYTVCPCHGSDAPSTFAGAANQEEVERVVRIVAERKFVDNVRSGTNR